MLPLNVYWLDIGSKSGCVIDKGYVVLRFDLCPKFKWEGINLLPHLLVFVPPSTWPGTELEGWGTLRCCCAWNCWDCLGNSKRSKLISCLCRKLQMIKCRISNRHNISSWKRRLVEINFISEIAPCFMRGLPQGFVFQKKLHSSSQFGPPLFHRWKQSLYWWHSKEWSLYMKCSARFEEAKNWKTWSVKAETWNSEPKPLMVAWINKPTETGQIQNRQRPKDTTRKKNMERHSMKKPGAQMSAKA